MQRGCAYAYILYTRQNQNENTGNNRKSMALLPILELSSLKLEFTTWEKWGRHIWGKGLLGFLFVFASSCNSSGWLPLGAHADASACPPERTRGIRGTHGERAHAESRNGAQCERHRSSG